MSGTTQELSTAETYVGVAGTPVHTIHEGNVTEPTTTYTPAAKEKFERLLTEFRTQATGSVESILKRGQLMCEAKETFERNKLDYTFDKFCMELLGVKSDHSNVRKWIRIGHESTYEEGRLHAEDVRARLPDAWTTIYTISSLTNTQFQTLLKDKRFSRNMTGEMLEKIVPEKFATKTRKGRSKGGAKAAKSKTSETVQGNVAEPSDAATSRDLKDDAFDITIKVPIWNLDRIQRTELHDGVVQLAQKFGLHISGDLHALIEDPAPIWNGHQLP